MRQRTTSKPEVISAIKAAARRLKRTPTRSEFERLSGIHWTKVQRLFGGYRAAVREAGLEPDPGGIRIDTAAMLADFGRVAREVKRHPTRDEYEKLGKFASASLETRFRRWSAVRVAFLEYVTRNGLDREWGDVAEGLRNGPVPRRGGGKAWLSNRRDRASSPSSRVIGKPTPLKRRGTEETGGRWAGEGERSEPGESANGSKALADSVKVELLPQMDADEHGSKPFLPRINANQDRSNERQQESGPGSEALASIVKPEVLPQMGADESGSRPEPIRAEILYPELRGMRCVTHVMLWVMSMQQSSQQHNDQPGHEGAEWDENRRDRTSSPASQVIGKPAPDALGRPSSSEVMSCSLNLYFSRRIIPGRPLMGPPLLPFFCRSSHIAGSWEPPLVQHGMAYEPVNEMGVVFLFGMVAPLLGFRVEALQAGFPDCKAKLEMEPGRWQDVNVEFEFESRKFRDHHHDPDKCDIIVCWRHNWKGCPERIQVLELSSILGVR